MAKSMANRLARVRTRALTEAEIAREIDTLESRFGDACILCAPTPRRSSLCVGVGDVARRRVAPRAAGDCGRRVNRNVNRSVLGASGIARAMDRSRE